MKPERPSFDPGILRSTFKRLRKYRQINVFRNNSLKIDTAYLAAGFNSRTDYETAFAKREEQLKLTEALSEGFSSIQEYEIFKKRMVPLNGKPITIAFDPKYLKGCMRVIWNQPVTRTLWIGCRWRYLTSQHYNGAVIRASRRVTTERPKTKEHLKSILCETMWQHWGWCSTPPEQFWTELLPFVVDALSEDAENKQTYFPFYEKHRFTWAVVINKNS